MSESLLEDIAPSLDTLTHAHLMLLIKLIAQMEVSGNIKDEQENFCICYRHRLYCTHCRNRPERVKDDDSWLVPASSLLTSPVSEEFLIVASRAHPLFSLIT